MNPESRLSIIIATRNTAADLRVTLDAIAEQQCPEVEILVQDALSTDGTAETARAYIPARLAGSLCSEKDGGIYDAWNKALARISGDWVLFMGAGDTFTSPHALRDALAALAALPPDCLFYSVPVRSVFPPGGPLELLLPASDPLQRLPQGMCLPHQGLFHRSILFENRRFNPEFRIAGDYDFVCGTLTPENFRIGTEPCVRMLFGGLSSDMRHMLSREKEFWHISRRYFPKAFPWKIAARAVRCVLYTLLNRLAGPAAAGYFADIPRRLRGLPPLWTRPRPPEKPLKPLPEKPAADLVIATLGRTDELALLLESLRQQRYKNFRILISDQNPAGFLDTILNQFADLPVTRIQTPPSGVSEARNALLPLLSGDIVAFPDDDCRYEPDTLETAVALFRQHAEAGALLGIHAEKRPAAAAEKDIKKLGQYACFFGSETYLQYYRREVIEAVGEFDPRLGPGTDLPYGCGEDTDYLLRARKTRHAVLRAPGLPIHHPLPDYSPQSLPKVRAYGRGRMFLLRKHDMPLWFKLANVCSPLASLPAGLFSGQKNRCKYRFAMFTSRLRGLFD